MKSPFALGLCFVLTVMAGCATQQHPNPLAGWKPLYGREEEKVDAGISDDYRDYIQHLSATEREYMGPREFFENGTGQHAVRLESDINGNEAWYHILVYDKDNKRIKVIKYYKGRYRS
jgi:hypothetical protein